MLMEIKGIEKLYRIKRLTGSCYYVVTDSIEALAKFCVAKEKSGYLISSITEIQLKNFRKLLYSKKQV